MRERSLTTSHYVLSWIAAEVSTISRYYDEVVQWQPRSGDSGGLLEMVEGGKKTTVSSVEELTEICQGTRSVLVIVHGNSNYDLDIQGTLTAIHGALNRTSRLLLVTYNSYLNWLYKLAGLLGIRRDAIPSTFITRSNLASLSKLAGFEVVRSRAACSLPLRLGKLSDFANRYTTINPFARVSALAEVSVLRPILVEKKRPSLSVVVPTRNERGNILNVLERMPDLGCELEVIFVEGHSKDGTWEEIQRLVPQFQDRFPIKCLQQAGIGKCDAVRLGFSQATGELLTILDADLTMPPELLGRFYAAYLDGHGDFVNGNRLTYPMEGKAMRFLNRLGNLFFAKALSAVLEVPLGDTLCGTKLMTRQAYQRMCEWRKDFGDFDPFGDFELLFPAAIFGLGIVDLPIRYRDRTYGTTNISRFRHGFILLKMTCIGLFRVRISPAPRARNAG